MKNRYRFKDLAMTAFLICSMFHTAAQQSLKILPLGNSVTRGSMCLNGDINTCVRLEDPQSVGYRQRLYNLLNNSGYTIDFVGSQQYGTALMSDPDNAGFSGIRSDKLADIMQTGTSSYTGQVAPGAYLNYYPADIVLLHIGTNDVLDGNYSSNGIARILDAIKNYETASGKPVLVLLAKIISVRDYACNTHSGTIAFNNNLVTMAQTRINNGDHIVLVDMECGAGMNYSTDLVDQVHPNQAGYNKMADKWYGVIHNYNNAPVVAGIPDQSVKMKESFSAVALDLYVADLEDSPRDITWKIIPADPNHLNITVDVNRIAHITVKDPLWQGSETVEFVATDRGRVLTQLQKSHSTPVTFTVTQPDPPAAPGSLTATAASTHAVDLTWTDNATNEDGYEIYRSLLSGDNFVLVHTASAGISSWKDNSCLENTRYYYRVRAFNPGGYSSYSNEASAVTPRGIPAAPADLTLATDSVSAVFLNWKDNSSNEDGFEIERATGNGTAFNQVFTAGKDITNYTDTGLSGNIAYSYRLRAFNTAGTSSYTEVAAITIPNRIPETPANLREVLVTHQSVILAWDNPTPYEYVYELQYSVAEEGPFTAVQVDGDGSMAYVVNGLKPDTWYYFRIRAMRDTLKSPVSDIIAIKTLVDPNLPAGIGELNNKSFSRTGLVIYPNPLRDKAFVSFSAATGSSCLIRLYDMQGNLVLVKPLLAVTEQHMTPRELDTSALIPGIYMLVLTVQDVILSKRIVIE